MHGPPSPLHGPAHDGIRDPFAWSRFGRGRTLIYGLLVVLTLVVVSTRSREGEARRAGFQAATHIVEQTWRIERSLTGD